MRKVVWLMHVSLDGFVAGPNGEIDWVRFDDDLVEDVQALVDSADTALFGRVTYRLMESYWPTASESPTASKHDLDHSRWLNPAPKIVFSTTLKNVHWQNTRIVKDHIGEEIAQTAETAWQEPHTIREPNAWVNVHESELDRRILLQHQSYRSWQGKALVQRTE